VGELAPVQSIEGMTGLYSSLKNSALSGIASGNLGGITDYLGGITPYIDFMKGLGDYNNLTGDVVSDLYDIQIALAEYKSAEQKAMEALTDSIDSNSDFTDENTTSLDSMSKYLEKQFGKITEDLGKAAKVNDYNDFKKNLPSTRPVTDIFAAIAEGNRLMAKDSILDQISGKWTRSSAISQMVTQVDLVQTAIAAAKAQKVDFGKNAATVKSLTDWAANFDALVATGDMARISEEVLKFPVDLIKKLGTTPSFAAGGLSIGPDSGYMATLHGTELVVSPRTSYPATVTAPAIDYDKLAQAIAKSLVPLVTRNNDGKTPEIAIYMDGKVVAGTVAKQMGHNTELIRATKMASRRTLS
jgi:hypothetical protein